MLQKQKLGIILHILFTGGLAVALFACRATLLNTAAPALEATPSPTPITGAAVSSSATYFDIEVEQPAADFTLTNQEGQPVSLHDFRGSYVLLNFVYTTCPDVCPLMTANFRRIQDELGDRLGRGVYLLSITIDPQTDTPERLKIYATAFGANFAGWSFLTGAEEAVYQVAEAYQQTFEVVGPGNIDHTALTVLIDPAGMERHRYWGTGFPPTMIVEKIEALGQQKAAQAGAVMAAAAAPAVGPPPTQAEIDALIGIPQGRYLFLIDAEEAEKFVDKLAAKMIAHGWTLTEERSGLDQGAVFFSWGTDLHIGIGRNLDSVVVMQDTDPVNLWTVMFERFKLYCCG